MHLQSRSFKNKQPTCCTDACEQSLFNEDLTRFIVSANINTEMAVAWDQTIFAVIISRGRCYLLQFRHLQLNGIVNVPYFVKWDRCGWENQRLAARIINKTGWSTRWKRWSLKFRKSMCVPGQKVFVVESPELYKWIHYWKILGHHKESSLFFCMRKAFWCVQIEKKDTWSHLPIGHRIVEVAGPETRKPEMDWRPHSTKRKKPIRLFTKVL